MKVIDGGGGGGVPRRGARVLRFAVQKPEVMPRLGVFVLLV